MSYYTYKQSLKISEQNYSFYALIMAAMRQADETNIELLKSMWPAVWIELFDRYHAPGGFLSSEEERYETELEVTKF